MASRLLFLALCIVPVSAFIGKSSHTRIGSSKSRPTVAATTEAMDARSVDATIRFDYR
jgi:hypothetical protein